MLKVKAFSDIQKSSYIQVSIKSKVRAGARCLELTLHLVCRHDLVSLRENRNGTGTFTERQAEI